MISSRNAAFSGSFAIATIATIASAALFACGGEAAATPPPASGATAATNATTTASPATFADQVAAGQTLYGAKCAGCHGAGGEGKMGPKVVGLSAGALPLDPPAGAKYRKTQFKTVGDVAAFVVKNMPPDAPGSLSEEQYYDILAFDLKANGIDLKDKKLDGQLASTLEIPRH